MSYTCGCLGCLEGVKALWEDHCQCCACQKACPKSPKGCKLCI